MSRDKAGDPGKGKGKGKAKGEAQGSPLPPPGPYTLSDLEQVKVLANPLRIRILQELGEERTTKQVAEILGEKPTRLYHHVDVLERVGLIRLTRTQPNRGTVEKYFQAVARSFRTESGLFSTHATTEDLESLQTMVSTMLETTSQELRSLIADSRGSDLEEEGVLSFVEIRSSKKQLAGIREKLLALLQELAEDCEEDPEDESRRFRLMLAYYPLDTE